jgi:hypothetical protein
MVLAAAMESMSSIRRAIDTEVYALTYISSLPNEGTVSVRDASTFNNIILRLLSAPALWETKSLGILLGLVIIFAIGYIRSPWRKLPPGPRRLPILGNALQLRDKSWLLSRDCKERFGEFTDPYTQGNANVCLWEIAGELMYLDGAGQPIVVCNSVKSAFELLERRSSNYSDRPRFIMAQDILNGGLLLALMNYTDRLVLLSNYSPDNEIAR